MTDIIRRNTCATCGWKVGHGEESYCRRYPPVPVFVATMAPNGKVQEGIIAMFPKVKPDMWCGEFNPIVRDAGATIGNLPAGGEALAGRIGNGRS